MVSSGEHRGRRSNRSPPVHSRWEADLESRLKTIDMKLLNPYCGIDKLTSQDAEEHVDAAALLELARRRDPQINRATAYRTLSVLKKLRLIDELDLMHLQGEKQYFEPRTVRDD